MNVSRWGLSNLVVPLRQQLSTYPNLREWIHFSFQPPPGLEDGDPEQLGLYDSKGAKLGSRHKNCQESQKNWELYLLEFRHHPPKIPVVVWIATLMHSANGLARNQQIMPVRGRRFPVFSVCIVRPCSQGLTSPPPFFGSSE